MSPVVLREAVAEDTEILADLVRNSFEEYRGVLHAF